MLKCDANERKGVHKIVQECNVMNNKQGVQKINEHEEMVQGDKKEKVKDWGCTLIPTKLKVWLM